MSQSKQSAWSEPEGMWGQGDSDARHLSRSEMASCRSEEGQQACGGSLAVCLQVVVPDTEPLPFTTEVSQASEA